MDKVKFDSSQMYQTLHVKRLGHGVYVAVGVDNQTREIVVRVYRTSSDECDYTPVVTVSLETGKVSITYKEKSDDKDAGQG